MANTKTNTHLRKKYCYLATSSDQNELFAASCDVGAIGVGFARTTVAADCFVFVDDQGLYSAKDLAKNLRDLVRTREVDQISYYEEYRHIGSTEAGLTTQGIELLKLAGATDEEIEDIEDYISDIGVYFKPIEVNNLG